MKTVNMLEAKTNLSRLVAAATEGEVVVIANRGKPVVQLVPISNENTHTASKAAEWFSLHHLSGSSQRSIAELDAQITEEREGWE